MAISRQLLEKAGHLEKDTGYLIAKAQSGNQAAFEEIYRLHTGRVYALCLRILSDRSRADEMAQQIFVRAWAKLGSFRGESRLSTWLHRIAINMILEELNSSKRRCVPISETDSGLSSTHLEVSHNMKMDLEKAIMSLPQQARAVFVLHDVEGWKHSEIADTMGLAIGTCKAQLCRARRILREVLGS